MGETKHPSVTQNNGATENHPSRTSRKNGLIFPKLLTGKDLSCD